VRNAVVALAVGWLLPSMLPGQPAPPADSGVTIRTTVHEVVLDLIVRDSHGRQVKDLKPEEVEIFEDGVRQKIRSLRLVPGREVREQAAGAAKKPGAGTVAMPSYPLRTVNLICLVYHNIPADANLLKNVMDMTQQFLSNPLQPDTYIGVFRLDGRLVTLHPFTNNRDRLIQAARNAFAGPPPAAAEEAGVAKTPAPAADARGIVGTMSTQTGTLEVIARQQMDQLTTLLQQLSEVEGRKTILLVSPGVVNSRHPELLEAVLDKANRAQMTVYAIDANGPSTAGVDNQALGQVAAVSARQREINQDAATMMQNMGQDESILTLVRSSSGQAPLRALAEGTGGRLIATFDVKKPFQRVLEDVAAHYEATYQPSPEKLDGHLRTIDVKLARSGLSVQTRRGYFAVPDLGGGAAAVAPFETAALAALAAEPKPRAFDFDSGAFRFRSGEASAQYAIGFELPGAALTAAPDPGQQSYRLRVSLLALVKDASGQVVAKVSRDFPNRVTAEQLAALKAHMITYTQAIKLPPGRYTVETAAVDGEGARSSTRVFAIDNTPGKGLGLSDVVLVQALEPSKGQAGSSDPFELRHGRVVPELVPKLSPSAKPSVYFVVYPDKSKGEKPRFAAKVLLDGAVIGDQTGELPAPDPSGAIRMVVRLAPKPGQYEVKVTALQGSESVERSLRFSMASP
jgi:VWFA-related protein